jgi:hypothetical protein
MRSRKGLDRSQVHSNRRISNRTCRDPVQQLYSRNLYDRTFESAHRRNFGPSIRWAMVWEPPWKLERVDARGIAHRAPCTLAQRELNTIVLIIISEVFWLFQRRNVSFSTSMVEPNDDTSIDDAGTAALIFRGAMSVYFFCGCRNNPFLDVLPSTCQFTLLYDK